MLRKPAAISTIKKASDPLDGASPDEVPSSTTQGAGQTRFQVRVLTNTGEDVTLLCSSACTDEAECHRSLLRELIQQGDARPR